ncbi:PLP-dependent aminotransferase family protein [Paenibacillus sp. YN15]|uniref:aminotransferase-like domain-containing protein n=1 Tax=Paenibacillus sp. YN15 TaxID=1742774 RepID=UPI000DCB0727|nr:PLP-dependent aminotransferase family protein [Paenibacillus sp. YN15]RAV02687.1 PLP-dependent aminotransferase family protein [Paenibacillus sp. YN15]
MPFNSFTNYPMSWRPNRNTLHRPVYQSLASLLEHDITEGILVPGTKLPPQRELADFLDLNFTTVTRAYKICESKGLIYAIIGKGTFVSPNAGRSVAITKNKVAEDCIDLGFVASFEGSNALVAETARRVAEKTVLEELFNYNEPTGLPRHKYAGQLWMKELGISADAKHVAIVSGAQNGLAIALFALFEPGSRIAVDEFTYSNFIEISKLYRIQLLPIPGDSNGMLPDHLDQQCRLLEVHGIFLMPSCSNPTTIMMTDMRKHELAAVIRRHQLIVLEDDIHAFLTAGLVEDYRQPLYQLLPDQTLYICGTSKSLCSGLRVAYLVFGERFRERIEKAVFTVNVKTSSLDAEIISELIFSGKAKEIVDEKKRLAQSVNLLFASYFPQHASTGHALSYFRWLPISNREAGAQLEQTLLLQGVRVFHSDRFRSGASIPGHFLRISLASTDSLKELDKGLGILRGVVN